MNRVLIAAMLALGTASVGSAEGSGWVNVQNDRYPTVEGSGRIVAQNRAVAPFNRIELQGAADADIQLGRSQSVTVQADDNLLPMLTSEVRGGTLILGSRGSFRTRRTPHARITVPNLAAVETNGSGDVILTEVANRQLQLASRGSGNIRASGRTGALDLKLQGSGDANLAALDAGEGTVGVFGSGDAVVRVSGRLDASAFGSGNVHYIGRPASLAVRKGGSGDVEPGGL
jgi:hypothetical protein